MGSIVVILIASGTLGRASRIASVGIPDYMAFASGPVISSDEGS